MKKIMVLLSTLIMLCILAGCGEVDTNDTDGGEDTVSVVYEDEVLKVTFNGLSDVTGNIGMAFSLENKSESEITVYPLDSSINDVMVQFTSGAPATIQAKKIFNQIWLANPQTVGISNYTDVTKIEFVLTYNDIETDTLKIEI